MRLSVGTQERLEKARDSKKSGDFAGMMDPWSEEDARLPVAAGELLGRVYALVEGAESVLPYRTVTTLRGLLDQLGVELGELDRLRPLDRDVDELIDAHFAAGVERDELKLAMMALERRAVESFSQAQDYLAELELFRAFADANLRRRVRRALERSEEAARQ